MKKKVILISTFVFIILAVFFIIEKQVNLDKMHFEEDKSVDIETGYEYRIYVATA